MDAQLLKELSLKFPELPLRYDVPWAEVTSLGCGGTIDLLAEPSDDISLSELLKFCAVNNIEVQVLGDGRNMVGSDRHLNILFMKLRQNDFVRIHFGRHHVTAGAGVRLGDFVRGCAGRGYNQFNHLGGIPGSVGGALRMNAGAFDTEIGSFVSEMFGFDMNGDAWSIDGCDVQWDYRTCSIPAGCIITGAIFKLNVDIGCEDDLSRTLELRKDRYPAGHSAGCVFKNPDSATPAGMLIEKCGLKGSSVNFMNVSEKHANWIIRSRHSATAADFVELAKKVRKEVFEKYNILLEPEVRFADSRNYDDIENSIKPLKICILYGGVSSEREVSLESGCAVAAALRNAGHEVELVDLKQLQITDDMRQCDLIFPVLHGGFGEDGRLQKLLELEHLRFAGCGSDGCELLMDKLATKKMLAKYNLPTPRWFKLGKDSDIAVPDGFEFPLVVKIPHEGSSMGLFIVSNVDEYEAAVSKCFENSSNILVEQYIEGIETTVAVVDGKALPMVEIVPPAGSYYDYDAKYTHNKGDTLYLCPPEHIDDELQCAMQHAALEFCRKAGATELARVDFIVDPEKEQFFILEGNSIPGFTASSLVPKAAAQAGMSFTMLCAELAKVD